MCTATPIDRATAHKINPLVSSLWTEDTLDSLAGVVDDLGYFLSIAADPPEGQEPHFGRLYLIFSAIAGALAYEAENIYSVAHARKERQHV